MQHTYYILGMITQYKKYRAV